MTFEPGTEVTRSSPGRRTVGMLSSITHVLDPQGLVRCGLPVRLQLREPGPVRGHSPEGPGPG